jgi:hypothetical protein
LIQPAGISGGKLPSVHPCPKILALQSAIFEAAVLTSEFPIPISQRRNGLRWIQL